MARKFTLGICFSLMIGTIPLYAQTSEDRLGLPGDNLNLAAVLDIFQKSPTLEDFEAALNADTSKVNNLDLNNDNQVDYIKVIDKQLLTEKEMVKPKIEKLLCIKLSSFYFSNKNASY